MFTLFLEVLEAISGYHVINFQPKDFVKRYMEFRTSIGIDAFADDVWHVLTDIANWQEWNTTVDKVTGKVAIDQQIKIYTNGDTTRAFNVKVTELAKPSRMVWAGGLPFGLLTAIRTFSLTKGAGSFYDFTVHEQRDTITGF